MPQALPTEGLSQLVCTVLAVQLDIAVVRDQLGRQINVRRDILRNKGAELPEPGERWIIDRSLGNEWTFAAIIGVDTTPPVPPPTPRPPVMPVLDIAGRNAISAPAVGQMALRTSDHMLDFWDGVQWRGLRLPPPIYTGAVDTGTPNDGQIWCSMFVPDPGWDYRLQFNGTIGTTIDGGMAYDWMMRDGDETGAICSTTSFDDNAASADVVTRSVPMTGTSFVMSGSRTVVLVSEKVIDGTSGGHSVAGLPATIITAQILPV